MKKKIVTALIMAILLLPTQVQASEKIDMKTYFPIKSNVSILFNNEYEEAKTFYTTTYLNMRVFPNIKSDVSKVLPPNTEVKVISDFAGWSKIIYGEEENEYYLWNEYLSEKRQVQGTYLGKFKLTAYCNCSKCCGKWSKYNSTASGTTPTQGRTVAMAGVPFGTKLKINGNIYTVEDRGTAYGHVDIFFNSHSEALKFGLQYADVYQIN